jgi:catechol 2,3-dioxygenase-like lactoylglutathione lyase family enzyme
MTSAGNRLSLPDRAGLKAPFAALHHVALVTNDMEKTVKFYRDVLGSEIAMAHRQGDRQVRHYFITVAPNTVFAFFEFPEAKMPEWLEATRPKSGRHLDHVDFYVESIDDIRYWEQRLSEHGIAIKRTIGGDSIFFHDPNNIVIQLTVGPQDKEPWPILDDPEPAY